MNIRPPEPLGLKPTFGFGDRLGLGTLGHVDALRAEGGPIQPIFAQQSTRELERTRRAPRDVIRDVEAALRAASFHGPWGADADHLKTQEDVNNTAGVGFVFFTLDPSGHVDAAADHYDARELRQRFHEIRDDALWVDDYHNRVVEPPDGPKLVFDELTVRRVAVKYAKAIAQVIKLAAHIERVMAKRGAPHEIELSLDEVPRATTPIEHFIIAEQCLRARTRLVSLAPRFVERFEVAVDYAGDVADFERAVAEHAAIARLLGPYKLSLHSGSDKFSIYAAFARATRGLFHVKTAGASYLEALRVAARRERRLFRRVIDFSRQRFDKDKATYQVSARVENTPEPDAVADDARLEQLYLDLPDGRQLLHVTYGSVLTDTALGPALRDVLAANVDLYRDVLRRRFSKHLAALRRGMPE